MKIQWLGHSCFLIMAEDGTKILTDPYDVKSYAGELTYKNLTGIKADIVTISHMTHPDHNHFEAVEGDRRILRRAAEREVKGIPVVGVNSFHDDARGSERGPNVIFIFTIDDVRVCHLGDIGHTLTEGNVRGMGDVDVLLVPVGGTYTVDSAQADQIVKTIKPKIVIPMHYKTDRCSFPIDPIGPFIAEKENVKQCPSIVSVTKDSLPFETETWVMEYTK